MEPLVAVAAAALRSLVTLLACTGLGGLILRRERGVSLGAFDGGLVVLLVVSFGWLAREVVRPRWRETVLRRVKVRLPSTSGADLLFDAAFLLFGLSFTWTEWAHPGQGHTLYGLGVGCVIVAAGLAALRLGFWRRRPSAE